MGVVDASGRLTAQTIPAIGSITATNGTIDGIAVVNVITGSVDHIIVLPDPVTVVVGGIQAFTATAYDIYNNEISGVDFVWTTNVGSVDPSGLLTAQTAPGSGIVSAFNNTISGAANVDIIAGPLDHILVTPDPETIVVGDSRSFTATGYDIYNNIITGMEFVWSVNIGSVDQTGLFAAPTLPGTAFVTASNGTESGSATVSVVPGPIDHILVIPDPANVEVGSSQIFTATAYDIYNNPIPGMGFDWTTDVGSVNVTGYFLAQAVPGTGTVTATNGTFSDLANVDVVMVTIDHILIVPDPATVVVGDTQSFVAIAFDALNNVISGVDFNWSTDVGTVDDNGGFTAQITPWVGIVTAENGTITYSATITVMEGPVDHIIVLPDPVTIVVGESQGFTATAYDVYNNVIPGIVFDWSTDIGSVDAGGLFTAQTVPGAGTVWATNGSISGLAIVNVLAGDISHIIVLPNPAIVTVGEFQQFTATAYDVYNNVVLGTPISWSTNVGVINSTGFLSAQNTDRKSVV